MTKNTQPDIFELGAWAGRRQAFAFVADHCSAGDAESLKQLRDSKAHEALGLTWELFCQQRLGVSRQTADRILQRLSEFGASFFDLARLTRVSSETYRKVEPRISGKTIEWKGEQIPIEPRNAARIAGIVRQLAAAGDESFERPIADLQKRFAQCILRSKRLGRKKLTAEERNTLFTAVRDTSNALHVAAIHIDGR